MWELPMNTLEVCLLGDIRVFLNGEPVGSFPTPCSAGLLAYLALNKGHSIHNDALAARFWPEKPEEQARQELEDALTRVRSRIEPAGVPPATFLTANGAGACLSKKGVWLDVEEFDGRMALFRRRLSDRLRLANLEECISLYRGPFMDGHDHQWCVRERERLRLALLTTLEILLEYHMEKEEWHLALQTGRTILSHDPLREHIHRRLMACHHLMGDRPSAIRQYREFEGLLDEEMGLKPMEATQELLRDILAETLRERLWEGAFPAVKAESFAWIRRIRGHGEGQELEE